MPYVRKILFFVLLTASALLAACSKPTSSSQSAESKAYADGVYAYDEDVIEEEYESLYEAGAEESGSADAKIIKAGSVNIETRDFDNADGYINRLISSVGGYVESSNLYYHPDGKNEKARAVNYCLRVPSESFDIVMDGCMSMGNVISSQTAATDETERYYDIGARLAAKEAEEQRLLELIAKADKMADLIRLEQRLSSVRTDIELYKSRQRDIDKKSSFSTIRLYIAEVADIDDNPETLIEKIKRAFGESIDGVVRFFQSALVFLVSACIPVLLIGAVGFIGWRVFRRTLFSRKKSRRKDIGEKRGEQ